MKYRSEIDGLRAVALLSVMLFHAGFSSFSGGFVGVDVFFVISGYLITSIALEEFEKGTFSFGDFYERRARRILPALFFVIICCIPLALLWMIPTDLEEFSGSVVAASLLVSNFFFWRESGYFADATELKPLLHTWSLSVEGQFYLIFPFAMLMLWRLGRRRIVVAMAIVAGMSLVLGDYGSRFHPTLSFYVLPTRLWEFIAGAICAVFVVKPRAARDELLSAVGLAAILAAVALYDERTPSPSLYALLPVLGTCAVLLFGQRGTATSSVLSSRPLVGIGLVSYSAYLWHQPLFAFARLRSAEQPSLTLIMMLILASFVLAYFSWRFVELPARRRAIPHARGGRTFLKPTLLAGSLLMMFGVIGYATDGFLPAFRLGAAGERLVRDLSSNYRQYVPARFDVLQSKKFGNDSSKRKVLIIGDSFAQDLVNALYEAGLANQLDLSTRHIEKQCGNLFVPRTLITQNADSSYTLRCYPQSLYEDAELRQLMRDADEVWFASSWQPWQAPLVRQSVENTEALTGKKVRVFGRKWLGRVNARKLINLSEEEMKKVRFSVPPHYVLTNRDMRSSLPGEVFIDVQTLLCGADEETCSPFSNEGELLTFDGTHLTRRGARYYGERVRQALVCDGARGSGSSCSVR
jgi:peptidoglycan/LPS O-acetylase OafA/YrhL